MPYSDKITLREIIKKYREFLSEFQALLGGIMLRILIADDKDLVRAGLRMLLEKHDNWTVCGEAVDGSEAVAKAIDLKPDLILLDIAMPKLDGLRACRLLRDMVPSLEILVLTLYESPNVARAAEAAGAHGYISKALIPTELIPAIETITSHQAA
ncbi:MAG: response regulator transcription factor [Candidatus Acidiferrales bacterium]